MLKQYTIFFSVLSISLLFSSPTQARALDGGNGESFPIVLELEKPRIQSHLVDISYEIYYPGFIEFHLFDRDGKQIFLTSMVKPKGKHAMRLKKEKLEPAHTYSYYFIYKGKEYHGTFQM